MSLISVENFVLNFLSVKEKIKFLSWYVFLAAPCRRLVLHYGAIYAENSWTYVTGERWIWHSSTNSECTFDTVVVYTHHVWTRKLIPCDRPTIRAFIASTKFDNNNHSYFIRCTALLRESTKRVAADRGNDGNAPHTSSDKISPQQNKQLSLH